MSAGLLTPFRWHPWPFEAAHALGAVPLLYLAWLGFRYQRRDPAYWWVAAGYFASFLADTAAHWIGHPLVSSTYPILQAGLIAAALLPAAELTLFVVVMAWAATTAVAWQGITGVDILLHTVCWLSLAGIAYRARSVPFRDALLTSFGVGWLAWLLYSADPGWLSWAGFQLTRVAGTAAFCVAVAHAGRPQLKIVRRAA